jgi:hypothetical protein
MDKCSISGRGVGHGIFWGQIVYDSPQSEATYHIGNQLDGQLQQISTPAAHENQRGETSSRRIIKHRDTEETETDVPTLNSVQISVIFLTSITFENQLRPPEALLNFLLTPQ